MNRNCVIALSAHCSFAVKVERYDAYSEELPEEKVEEVMEEAVKRSNDLRNKGIYPDFSHYVEPNGSGFDMVQLIDSGSGYTAVYFHIGEEVEKEGSIDWDRAVELLSYDPRKF